MNDANANYVNSQLDRLSMLGRKCGFSALEDGACCNSISSSPCGPTVRPR